MRYLLIMALPPALCFVAVLVAADPAPPGESDRTAGEVEVLIRQLGDKSFEVRQAATERLQERPDAIPALRRALKSDDPEVANRAKAILEGLDRRQDKKTLARLADFARNGEVDQAVDLLVRRETWADEDAAFRVMTDLAGRLLELGEKEFGKPVVPDRLDNLPAGDLTRYLKYRRPRFQMTGRIFGRGDPRSNREIPPDKRDTPDRADESLWIRAEEISVGLGGDDLLVAAEGVYSATDGLDRGRLGYCVVLSGGPVALDKPGEPIANSVIVCDGDFRAQDVMGCLIISRGNVRITRHASACYIIASGSVDIKESVRATQVKQKQPNPLGFVKWFDPASVGVVVEAAEGGVKIKQAEEGKPFAKAGLRAGDLAVSADDKKIDSPDAFRRLLRAKVVMGDELTLEVRRDGKPVKLAVNFSPQEPPKQ